MRAKKAFKNTIWGLLYEAVMIICNFVLPRLILTSFGSKYNGVTGAITQFLQVIALFQAGIGGVTMAALYKPLSENNVEQISIIVKTTESFMKKVVMIFAVVALVIACGYPFLVSEDFDWLFTASLVIIMSLSSFAQYFFGQTYQFLLVADQRQHIIFITGAVKVLMNTILSALLIYMGFGIRAVKLGSAVVFVLAPLFIYFYTRKKFKILPNVKKDNSVLKQRWDNFGIEIANFATRNAALIILSFFSNIYEISIYTVYSLIMSGIYALFNPFVNGINVAFGNMIAKEQQHLLQKNMRLYEQVVFAFSTFLFGVTTAVILPFINLYVKGAKDIINVNYTRPLFAYIFIAATLFQAIRYPYMGITQAAGHFKPMRNPAFIEVGINIGLSVALVVKLGIVGVIIGTFFSYVYRAVRYAIYLSKNIIPRSIMLFVKRIILSFVCIFMIAIISYILPLPSMENPFSWAISAIIVSVIALIIVVVVEILFYWNDLSEFFKMLQSVLRKRKRTAV